MTKQLRYSLLLILLVTSCVCAQTARRPLKLEDLFRFRDVRDPQVSPDGIGIGGEPVREQTPGGASADDDVIELVFDGHANQKNA